MSVTVTTQAELDAAIERGEDDILIDSPREVRMRVDGEARVTAIGSSTVTASDSAVVWAYDLATVIAYDSAMIEAYNSAAVTAYNSATVTASDSAAVTACGAATVAACGSATVRAYDSAKVRAYNSATVTASDSATVTVYGSATVRAYDSATVSASKYVAVHLHSQQAKVSGGVLIDMTTVDETNLNDWLDLTGATVSNGWITVYKAVNDSLETRFGFAYPVGTEVRDAGWIDDHSCGGGLHFSPTAALAHDYYGDATRFLECQVKASEVRCIDKSKLKAPRAKVIREVGLHTHRPVTA